MPRDADRPIAEEAAGERLIDIDRFDLVHVHLDRMAPDEAGLVDHARRRDRDLGAEAAKPGEETGRKPERAEDEGEAQDRKFQPVLVAGKNAMLRQRVRQG